MLYEVITLDLSFEFNDPEKIRTYYSYEIVKMLRQKLKPLQEQYPFVEFAVMERRVGLVKTDISINLIGNDDLKTQKALEDLKTALSRIKGTQDIVDNVRKGKIEYKIRITPYGEQLGLSEGYVASILSGYFLGKRKAVSFDENGVVEITTEFAEKDHLSKLIDFDVPLPSRNNFV